MPQLSHGISEAGVGAAVRSELYRILANSFKFPDLDFFEAVKSGRYFETLSTLIAAAPFDGREFSETDLALLAGFDGDLDQFCAEYIRLFEVGSERGRPPCPLYGGEYALRPRLEVMEELVRFYSYFDLALTESDRELPDHISVQLEFLHYLAFRESHSLEHQADPCAFRRAQADFIERQPGAWVPTMRERLESQDALPFFRGLISITAEIMDADLEYLRASLAK